MNSVVAVIFSKPFKVDDEMAGTDWLHHLFNRHPNILDAFEKLNASISFVFSVRPSVHLQLGSHCTDFHETRYLSIFRKSVEKIKVLSKSGNNNGFVT